MLLNHDATFLAELLDALTKSDAGTWPLAYQSWNCARLPKRADMPVVMRYVAAVNVLLGDYKVRDHEADSPSRRWRWARRIFSPSFRKAQQDLTDLGFPLEQTDALLSSQPEVETMRPADIDAVAAPTAEMTAIVFAHGGRLCGLDARVDTLRQLGHHFGRLIYLLDAWQDFDRDARTGAFNALRASGYGKDWGAAKLREETISVIHRLEALNAPKEFAARVRTNLDAALGSPLRILHACGTRRSWREAVARTRAWRTPVAIFGAVAIMAFLFHRHARFAKSSRELLSMAMNLMAVSGVFAMVADGRSCKGQTRKCLSSCCCDPGFDCCCEGCCESCNCGECCCSACDCSGCDCCACDC
jgi:hypothetical protein